MFVIKWAQLAAGHLSLTYGSPRERYLVMYAG